MKTKVVLYGNSNIWGWDPDGFNSNEPYQVRYPKEKRIAGHL